jgi:hypothetical protein
VANATGRSRVNKGVPTGGQFKAERLKANVASLLSPADQLRSSPHFGKTYTTSSPYETVMNAYKDIRQFREQTEKLDETGQFFDEIRISDKIESAIKQLLTCDRNAVSNDYRASLELPIPSDEWIKLREWEPILKATCRHCDCDFYDSGRYEKLTIDRTYEAHVRNQHLPLDQCPPFRSSEMNELRD